MWRYRYFLGALFGAVLGLLVLKELHILSVNAHAIFIVLSLAVAGLSGAAWFHWRDRHSDALRKIKALDELSLLKTDLLSVAAHEIRTPITSIEWGVKMLLDGEYGEISANMKEVLLEIYRGTLGLRSSSNDFLTMARLERNVLEIDLKVVKVSRLEKHIREVVGDFDTEIKGKKLSISLSSKCPDDFSLMADIGRLTEVIRNFMENAINYTPEGGKISALISTTPVGLFFEVKDSGIGIPKEDQTKIFQKLFRAENARRARGTGAGLGLYLSKKFIEAHGGKIWFISKEGKGSRFFFFLPSKLPNPTEEFFRKV